MRRMFGIKYYNFVSEWFVFNTLFCVIAGLLVMNHKAVYPHRQVIYDLYVEISRWYAMIAR